MSLWKEWPGLDDQNSAGRRVFSLFWIPASSQEPAFPPGLSSRRPELALVWELLPSHMPPWQSGLCWLLQRDERHSLSRLEHAEAPAGSSDQRRLSGDAVITRML